ncbi:MAG: 6-bladed beta-propeller [Candidatus Krumholzibacteriota bacterium]|nr:6-bladed beta-propeller [Candidatus Krumholzibacteriota bacterium]
MRRCIIVEVAEPEAPLSERKHEVKRRYSLLLIASVPVLLFPLALRAEDVKVVHNEGDGIWSSDPSKHIELIPDLVIGEEDGDDDLIFGRITAITVDSRLNIYVLDFGMNRVQMYDSNGVFVRSIGSEGEGPGHFFSPMTVSTDATDHVYVASTGRVSIWDDEGNYVDEFRHGLSGWVRSVAVVEGHGLFLACLDILEHKVIHKYNFGHESQVSFCDSYAVGADVAPPVEQFAGGGSVAIGPNGFIYFTQLYPYEIRIFTPDGSLLTRIERENDFTIAPAMRKLDSGGMNLRMGTMSGPIMMLGNDVFINMVFIPRSGDEGSMDTVIDAFHIDGRLLTTNRFENRTVSLRCADRLGRVYAADREEFPRVVRYRISFGG